MGWMGDGYWRKEANESEVLSMEDKEAASLERRRSLVGYVGESVQAWEGRG